MERRQAAKSETEKMDFKRPVRVGGGQQHQSARTIFPPHDWNFMEGGEGGREGRGKEWKEKGQASKVKVTVFDQATGVTSPLKHWCRHRPIFSHPMNGTQSWREEKERTGLHKSKTKRGPRKAASPSHARMEPSQSKDWCDWYGRRPTCKIIYHDQQEG